MHLGVKFCICIVNYIFWCPSWLLVTFMDLPGQTGSQFRTSPDESKQRVTYHLFNVTAQKHTAVFHNSQHGFMCNWGGTRKESRGRCLNSSLKIDCNSLFSATQNITTRALNSIFFFHTVSTHPKFASPLWAWKDRKKRKNWTWNEIEVYVRGTFMVWIFKIILQRNIEGASFFICPYFKHKKTLPTLTRQGLL